MCDGTGLLLKDVCPLCDGEDADGNAIQAVGGANPAARLPFTRQRSSLSSPHVSNLRAPLRCCAVTRIAASPVLRPAVSPKKSKPKSPMRGRGITRRDSQLAFAEQSQTVIVFDWDDTLFPTSYVTEDLEADWSQPLRKQRHITAGGHRCGSLEDIRRSLALCEKRAAELLRKAHSLGHVVVVTLASSGWVGPLCENFYPQVGRLMEELNVRVVYAQEHLTDKDREEAHELVGEEVERYWGLLKGRAISDICHKFYSQYQGQSWKNVLSIGDSSFERYGLLAATGAYWRGRELGEAGRIRCPSDEDEWKKVEGGRILKMRAKCFKLVDVPNVDELICQLEVVAKWLEPLVRLDGGFDLDLEAQDSDETVQLVEAVLRGELPPSSLPSHVSESEEDVDEDTEDENPRTV